VPREEISASARSSPQRLGYDLSVLHDEGVIAKLEAVVRRLGLPQDVGDVADAVQVSITP
jgi:hypothetical protein